MTIAAVDLFPLSGDWRSITEPVPTSTVNDPPVQIVSALVDFTPRIPLGFQFYLPMYQVEGNNAVILLGWIGGAFSGTWTFTYGGQHASGLGYNISASALQTALRGLSSIGAGNINVTTVTGTADTTAGWFLEFTGALANTPISAASITIDNSLLVGATINPYVEEAGHAIAYRDTSLVLDPIFNARVWEGQLSTINVVDSPGFQLPACTPAMQANLTEAGIDSLIYDVRFTQVTYARSDNALQNFAFVAPTAPGVPVCITDPGLLRLPYKGASTDIKTSITVSRIPKRVALVDGYLTFYDGSGSALPDPILFPDEIVISGGSP